jgi:hypothetical protein
MGKAELRVEAGPLELIVTAGKSRFTFSRGGGEGGEVLLLPGNLGPEPYPLTVSGETLGAVSIGPGPFRPFPAEPIPGDPGLILAYDQNFWRDRRYEVFRWTTFPEILIFDTLDYAFQDRLLKRLAFFVEKAGFRGRLAPDGEIADIHGWNAHDYRAEDLARFFEAARKTSFPLLNEERELEDLLLKTGILRRADSGNSDTVGEIIPGTGAIIAISRESPDYLRYQFMTHEGYHGIFFLDEEFREFSRGRWNGFDGTAKRFIRSYFESRGYDISDSYLLVNEFMAHIMQQPSYQAGRYFGENLARQLDESWRRNALPQAELVEDQKTWPDISRPFRAEAEAFSNYTRRRWGLEAGRIRLVTVSVME